MQRPSCLPLRRAVVPVILAVLATTAAAQQPAFLASQRQVNQVISNDQTDPSVARSPDGTTWVVWESWSSAGNDSDLSSIQMQRYLPGGQPLGSQIQVNTAIAGPQTTPAVACDPVTGAVMVVWESPGATAGDAFDIRARVFAGNGTPLADDFTVNLLTPGDQLDPAVAGEIQGFVVVWKSDDDTGSGIEWNIAARAFEANGLPASGELLVNDLTTGSQERPAIAASDDDFLVVWQRASSAGSDNTTTSIQGRWLLGGWGTTSFQVNQHPPAMSDSNPAVAVVPGGAALVLWESFGSVGNDASRYAIQARRFSAAGNTSQWSLTVP